MKRSQRLAARADPKRRKRQVKTETETTTATSGIETQEMEEEQTLDREEGECSTDDNHGTPSDSDATRENVGKGENEQLNVQSTDEALDKNSKGVGDSNGEGKTNGSQAEKLPPVAASGLFSEILKTKGLTEEDVTSNKMKKKAEAEKASEILFDRPVPATKVQVQVVTAKELFDREDIREQMKNKPMSKQERLEKKKQKLAEWKSKLTSVPGSSCQEDENGVGEINDGEVEDEKMEEDQGEEEGEIMEDVHTILEESVQPEENAEVEYDEVQRTILIEMGLDPLASLPEGWTELTHVCGMPMFYNQKTRLVTWSRPYYVSHALSIRRHKIPLGAIPCLQYRMAKEKAQQSGESARAGAAGDAREAPGAAAVATSPDMTTDSNAKAAKEATSNDAASLPDSHVNGKPAKPTDVKPSAMGDASSTAPSEVNRVISGDTATSAVSCSGAGTPEVTPEASTNGQAADAGGEEKAASAVACGAAEVQIVRATDIQEAHLLDGSDLKKYCDNLFNFKTVTVKKFKSWQERRKFQQEERDRGIIEKLKPSVDQNSKLVTYQIPNPKNPKRMKTIVFNPEAERPTSLLYKYANLALKVNPTFEFVANDSTSQSFCCEVWINKVKYGTGMASSKKIAKNEAAREAMNVLIPGVFNNTEKKTKDAQQDESIFDDLPITDRSIYEITQKLGRAAPMEVLNEFLRRHFGLLETRVETSVTKLSPTSIAFSMKVGQHEAAVTAKSKKEGKQLAAQHLLQKLHPEMQCWGSVLRLHDQAQAQASTQENKAKLMELEQIVGNKSEGKRGANAAVLRKLQEDMLKIMQEEEKKKEACRRFEWDSRKLQYNKPPDQLFSSRRGKSPEKSSVKSRPEAQVNPPTDGKSEDKCPVKLQQPSLNESSCNKPDNSASPVANTSAKEGAAGNRQVSEEATSNQYVTDTFAKTSSQVSSPSFGKLTYGKGDTSQCKYSVQGAEPAAMDTS